MPAAICPRAASLAAWISSSRARRASSLGPLALGHFLGQAGIGGAEFGGAFRHPVLQHQSASAAGIRAARQAPAAAEAPPARPPAAAASRCRRSGRRKSTRSPTGRLSSATWTSHSVPGIGALRTMALSSAGSGRVPHCGIAGFPATRAGRPALRGRMVRKRQSGTLVMKTMPWRSVTKTLSPAVPFQVASSASIADLGDDDAERMVFRPDRSPYRIRYIIAGDLRGRPQSRNSARPSPSSASWK